MPPRRLRLDAELVRRGLARSRDDAARLVAEGRVTVAGSVASKPATQVTTDQPVIVTEVDDDPHWASRGAYKLLGALEVFEPGGLAIEGRRCLDAGASTGGFTDVLLRRGAARVLAVDVGYGQLTWGLRSDPRVEVHDRTNVRTLDLAHVGDPVDLVVGDLSFISLTLVLSALTGVTRDDGDLALMVKPQFEVGRERLGRGGVVRDPALRADAVRTVCARALTLGWGVRDLAPSPLPGPAGNVEYFCWLRRDAPELTASRADEVVAAGPGGSAESGPGEMVDR